MEYFELILIADVVIDIAIHIYIYKPCSPNISLLIC